MANNNSNSKNSIYELPLESIADGKWPRSPFVRYQRSTNVSTWNDVRYVLINQHGGTHNRASKILTEWKEEGIPTDLDKMLDNLKEAIDVEADTYAFELVEEIVNQSEGVLAVHILLPRALVDLNRRRDRRNQNVPDDRYTLQLVERIYLSAEENLPMEYPEYRDFALGFFDTFRGQWQTGPKPGRTGILEKLHRRLPSRAFFWDFHTYDKFDSAGNRRPFVQTFSVCCDDPSDPDAEELIPHELCRLVEAVVKSDGGLRGIQQKGDTPGANLFAIDRAYQMFRGCTPEHMARHRNTIVTEIRKDLVEDNPKGVSGENRSAIATMCHRIGDAVADRLKSDQPFLRFPDKPIVSWAAEDEDRFLRVRQEIFLDPMGSNRARIEKATVLLQQALFDWYLSEPGEFGGMLDRIKQHLDTFQELEANEQASLSKRRFALRHPVHHVPAVESGVSNEHWQDIVGSLDVGFDTGKSFLRFIRDLDKYTNPSLRINHRYVGELLPHDNMVSYLSSLVATFLNENAIIGKVSPCVTHMEEAIVAWLTQLIGWEGRLEVPDDIGHLPVPRLFTPYPPAKDYEARSREQPAGTIVGGGTVANISAIVIARNATLNYLLGWGEAVQTIGPDAAWNIVKEIYGFRRMAVVTSKGAHYSVSKAALFAGLGEPDVYALAGAYSPWILDAPPVLEKLRKLREENKLVVAVVALAGKTETGYVDDILSIAEALEHADVKLPDWKEVGEKSEEVGHKLKNFLEVIDWSPVNSAPETEAQKIVSSFLAARHSAEKLSSQMTERLNAEVVNCSHNRIFLHVDAAHGGGFLTVPNLRARFFRGIEYADSVTLDGHKMFYCYYPCGGLLSRTSRWMRSLHCGLSTYISEDTNEYAYQEDRGALRDAHKETQFGKSDGWPLVHPWITRDSLFMNELAANRTRAARPSLAGTELDHLPFVNCLEGSRGCQGIMQLYFNLSTLGRKGYRSLLEWTYLLARRTEEAVSLGTVHVRPITEDDTRLEGALGSAKDLVTEDAKVGRATHRVLPVLGGRLFLLSKGQCNQVLVSFVPSTVALKVATEKEAYWNEDGSCEEGPGPGMNRFWKTLHYMWRVNENLWSRYLYANPAFSYYVGHTEFRPILPSAWPHEETKGSRAARLAGLLTQWNTWARWGRDSTIPCPFFKVLAEYVASSEGYDLKLTSVSTTNDLLDEGRSLVVVAHVDNHLHIRIFDASGEKVVDKAQNKLISGEALAALKRLNPLPDKSSLSPEDKREIIGNATTSADHARPISDAEGAPRLFCQKIVLMHPFTDESVLSDLLGKIVFWGERSASDVDRSDVLASKTSPGARAADAEISRQEI